MKKWLEKYCLSIVLLLGIIAVQGCATMGGAPGSSNNIRVYDMAYEDMTEIVERAIRGSNFSIAHVDDSEADQVTMMVAREAYMGGDNVQREQGSVRVQRLEDDQSQVEIENPEYHFSIPDNQKINYRRILFNRIEDLVE